MDDPKASEADRVSRPDPPLTEHDAYLFNEGTHYRLYRHLGAHMRRWQGDDGVSFAVWAPNARTVSVIGDFNNWQTEAHPMEPVASTGVWHAFVPGLQRGENYKYHIASHFNGYAVDKADPFGFHHETPSRTASKVWDLEYTWDDAQWMTERSARHQLESPISIYEMHLGSWKRHSDRKRNRLSYEQLAEVLPAYLQERGFTHVEFLPVTEHPLYRSWGYQPTGYFAPTSRFGPPQGFMHLVDSLHQAGIGVILDWVPSHFPSDEHGLGYFDGTHLFEHADPRLGFHPDWKSLIFNYGRNEVRAFLISSALFWLDAYHIDGLRVDAVASMLYLDYSREEGEWLPNREGGRENVEAIDFLQRLNSEVQRSFPDVMMFAEESTAWPRVTGPVSDGGLGFQFKWDMGWMHDRLQYFQREPVYRKFHHNELTFRGMYMCAEHYLLALSHDEVVHGKGSLPGKMSGDDWQRMANLRLLLTDQWMQPGKKLLFMGCEFAQSAEWNYADELQWDLLNAPRHRGILHLVDRLNELYRHERALHELDVSPDGFTWLDADDADHGLLAFLRLGQRLDDTLTCVFNMTPVTRTGVPIGVPMAGHWRELLNTDALEYGGSGVGNLGGVTSQPVAQHEQPHRISLTVPPLGALVLKWSSSP